MVESRMDKSSLQLNGSLDVPQMSKSIYWITLGPLLMLIGWMPFVFQWIGIIKLPFNPIDFAAGCLWLGLWGLAAVGLYSICCRPKTKNLREGLMIRGEIYRWEEFNAFKIQQERIFVQGPIITREILFLHLLRKQEPIRVNLGKRNPAIIRNFLQEKITVKN